MVVVVVAGGLMRKCGREVECIKGSSGMIQLRHEGFKVCDFVTRLFGTGSEAVTFEIS